VGSIGEHLAPQRNVRRDISERDWSDDGHGSSSVVEAERSVTPHGIATHTHAHGFSMA
jgi:hypothetical protein